MGFNINSQPAAQASEHGYQFEPVYPGTRQGIGATITVRGPHSEAVREHARLKLRESQTRELVARKRGKSVEPLTLDDVESNLVALAVAYTMGWDGMETQPGQPLPFSPAAAAEVYRAHPWMRDQVIEEAQDLGNFIKPSSPSSSNTPEPSSA